MRVPSDSRQKCRVRSAKSKRRASAEVRSYHQRVFLESALALEPVMAFHAGTHRDAVRMRADDFVNLGSPVMARFGEPAAQEAT